MWTHFAYDFCDIQFHNSCIQCKVNDCQLVVINPWVEINFLVFSHIFWIKKSNENEEKKLDSSAFVASLKFHHKWSYLGSHNHILWVIPLVHIKHRSGFVTIEKPSKPMKLKKKKNGKQTSHVDEEIIEWN